MSILEEVEQARVRHCALPHDFQAEQAIIGGILRQNNIFYLVGDFILPHYSDTLHLCLYSIIKRLLRSSRPAAA